MIIMYAFVPIVSTLSFDMITNSKVGSIYQIRKHLDTRRKWYQRKG